MTPQGGWLKYWKLVIMLGCFATALQWATTGPARSLAVGPVIAEEEQVTPDVHVDNHIPLWGILLSLASLITTLATFGAKIRSHSRQHKLHFQHAADTDSHWTRRERDELKESIKELHVDVKSILKKR